ncbi:hypothetical protein OXPF_11840 [Oxobacter pfennigii]|uniref:Radical SAM core domain-containing protein n=1 Tax=Oxobacter pfennigii TaxID=36849 RepID=A0A0P8YDG2_9CLOT|nr:YgiQ family radical SAM protein [Oxobacter pfennigii]KPU45291.1 hypothetical protein OXPF_11840 [Oxobacter pfennigii]
MTRSFLPVNKKDMMNRGWEQLDFLFISGDAYVDHPSFGHAIITRLLEAEGFKVGIIAQPDWNDVENFKIMGTPRFGVLISSGNIDSMVNHYTVSKKKRSDDCYTPGGKGGKRPDRADIVYANRAREAFKNIPVILGGIEGSLRRFAHYDYWDDKVRRSILMDSKADLLIYGMGEKTILEVANLLRYGKDIKEIRNTRGTCYLTNNIGELKDYILIDSFEEVSNDKKKYALSYKVQYEEQDAISGKVIVQPHGDRFLVQNPPALHVTTEDLDRIYDLPYMRKPHHMYERLGGVPAIEEVKFSITSHRGCFGGCSFCALNFHQGRTIQSRSHQSIINEVKELVKDDDFKGYIHDVGGPTANFREASCHKQKTHGVCKNKQCLHPEACKNLIVDHRDYLKLLREIREVPGVKKVFVRSGIRYDYLLYDKSDEFFKELCKYHISGQLKVAPEHVSDRVLEKMGKPGRKTYDRFVKKYYDINKKLNKKQFLVPYLMSSHPGSDIYAAIELAEYIRDLGYNPEQVQDFYPTPGSLSTCMYYTGLDPRTMEEVYVPKTHNEKALQRALLQYRDPKNYKLVHKALTMSGRNDLIGYDKNSLIKPQRGVKPWNKP